MTDYYFESNMIKYQEENFDVISFRKNLRIAIITYAKSKSLDLTAYCPYTIIDAIIILLTSTTEAVNPYCRLSFGVTHISLTFAPPISKETIEKYPQPFNFYSCGGDGTLNTVRLFLGLFDNFLDLVEAIVDPCFFPNSYDLSSIVYNYGNSTKSFNKTALPMKVLSPENSNYYVKLLVPTRVGIYSLAKYLKPEKANFSGNYVPASETPRIIYPAMTSSLDLLPPPYSEISDKITSYSPVSILTATPNYGIVSAKLESPKQSRCAHTLKADETFPERQCLSNTSSTMSLFCVKHDPKNKRYGK